MTKRPTQFDDEILKLTAQSLLEEIKQWINSDGECPPDDEIVEDLTKAMQYNTDGFDIAKALEDYSYWDGDSELVSILDHAYFKMRNHLEKAEEKWVRENNLKPIPIGKKVKVLDGGKMTGCIGEVTENRFSGYSLVLIESLGHVREGNGTHGVYIAWEKLSVMMPEYGEGC